MCAEKEAANKQRRLAYLFGRQHGNMFGVGQVDRRDPVRSSRDSSAIAAELRNTIICDKGSWSYEIAAVKI